MHADDAESDTRSVPAGQFLQSAAAAHDQLFCNAVKNGFPLLPAPGKFHFLPAAAAKARFFLLSSHGTAPGSSLRAASEAHTSLSAPSKAYAYASLSGTLPSLGSDDPGAAS